MRFTCLLVLVFLFDVDGRVSIQRNWLVDGHSAVRPNSEANGTVSAFTNDATLHQDYFNTLPSQLELRSLGKQSVNVGPRATAMTNATINLIRTIRKISDGICNGIRNLFDKFGLPQPPRRKPLNDDKIARPTNLKFAVYYELLRIPLEIAPILKSLKTQLTKHMNRHNYTSMGYKSVKIALGARRGNATEGWKFLAVFSSVGLYGTNVYNCLDEKSSKSFDLKQAVRHLTDFPLERTGDILRSRLGKRIPRSPAIKRAEYNQLHAFVCHAAANDSRLNYQDCLKEVKRVDHCAQARLNSSTSTQDSITESSNDLVRGVKGLIDLCDTDDAGTNHSVVCKLKKKPTNGNELPIILDFFIGDLKKTPGLDRMANDLGSTIRRSQMGSEALDEIATMVEMYKLGIKKEEQLLKSAQKDINQRHRYNRMSDHLKRYKRYCIDFANRTVRHLHSAMSSVENVFADPSLGIARVNLTENVQALRCWSGFVESIFGGWAQKPGYSPTTPYPTNMQTTSGSGFRNTAKRHRLPSLSGVSTDVGSTRNASETRLTPLIAAMKRIGQSGPPRRTSALVTIANTFLLATMFYESIALIAAAIYRQERGTVSNAASAENTETDPWPPRDRRSPTNLIEEKDLQNTEKEDAAGFSASTIEPEIIADTTLPPSFDGIQETVGNPTDDEGSTDTVESTTISNDVEIASAD